MREIRPSGSEGGAGFNPRLLPLSWNPVGDCFQLRRSGMRR